jgi:hypothetical protein
VDQVRGHLTSFGVGILSVRFQEGRDGMVRAMTVSRHVELSDRGYESGREDEALCRAQGV